MIPIAARFTQSAASIISSSFRNGAACPGIDMWDPLDDTELCAADSVADRSSSALKLTGASEAPKLPRQDSRQALSRRVGNPSPARLRTTSRTRPASGGYPAPPAEPARRPYVLETAADSPIHNAMERPPRSKPSGGRSAVRDQRREMRFGAVAFRQHRRRRIFLASSALEPSRGRPTGRLARMRPRVATRAIQA